MAQASSRPQQLRQQPAVRRAARPSSGPMTAVGCTALPAAGPGRRRRRGRRSVRRRPTTWPTSAGPTCCCSSRAPCRAAPPGTPPGWSGCCGPARAAPGWCSTPPSSTQRLEAETGLATGYRPVRRAHRRAHRRPDDGAAAHRRHRRGLRPRVRAAHPRRRRGSGTRCCAPTTSLGAIWLPGDGTANPTDVTQSLAKGARQLGVTVRERVRVTGFDVVADPAAPGGRRVRACAPTTATSSARSSSTAPASGPRRVGALAGVGGAAALGRALLRRHRPDRRACTATCRSCATPTAGPTSRRRSAASSSAGSSPRRSRGSSPEEIPYPFEFQLLDEDWEHFSVLMESALHRLPGARAHRHPQVLQRARELHPRQPVHARASRPSVAGFFVGAGFNSVGIASAGGAGRALAEWVVAGRAAGGPRAGRPPPVRAVPREHAVAARAGLRRCSGCTTPCRGRTASSTPAAAVPLLARARPAGGRRGVVRLQDGLGAAQLLRAAGVARPTARHLRLGPPALARLGRRRAARHPRGRRAVRPDVVRQAARARPRRAGPAAPGLRRRRRPAGGLGRLHRRAQRARRLRGRRHGRPGSADDEWLLVTSAASPVRDADWLRRHVAPGWRVAVEDVTTAYAVLGRDGPALARPAGAAHRRRPRRRGLPLRDEPGASTSGRRGCGPPG